ncbi:MAG: hypothetical protein KDC88_09755 [Ignavibacteriae bacterium]|nr:hypothetical protein [Ignavibacteriota bacterium]
MKLSKLILLSTLLLSTFAEDSSAAAVPGGSCKNGCVSCRTDGEVEWCLACRNKKHVMTTAINGKCDEASTDTGIPNCEISYVSGGSQVCIQCKEGFGLVVAHQKRDTTAKTRETMTGFQCRQISAPNTVTGFWHKGSADGETEEFFAVGCTYGYKTKSMSKDGKNKGTVCVLSSSTSQWYDENCKYWKSDNCVCKGNYGNYRGGCRKWVLNSVGSNGHPYNEWWSAGCNLENGFYPDEFKGYTFAGGEVGYSISALTAGNVDADSTFFSNPDSSYLALAHCTSDDWGKVGAFKILMNGALGLIIVFLFK